MPQINFTEPPKTGNEDFDRYMVEQHQRLFGLGADTTGDLNNENIETPIAVASGGTGNNKDPYARENHTGTQTAATISDFPADKTATAVADSVPSTVSVDTADADATYDSNEQTLINELKADVTTLVVDLNSAITQLNALMAAMRTAGLMAT